MLLGYEYSRNIFSGEKMFNISKFVVCALCFSCFVNVAYAHRSTVEQIGDYLQLLVPAYAFGMAMNEPDWNGVKQFAYSYGATTAAVYTLKYTVHERRPNKANDHSFPSGHTASAMSGATFIHKRYGLNRAIVPYLMTGFTAFARVDANKHWWWDTVAGAAIAGLITWNMVDRYENVAVSATPNGIRVNVKF